MRDIRGDLQDRANFLEEQISAARIQFEKRMERFAREHEAKISDLQAELEAVTMLMEREYRRIMSAPDVEDERSRPAVRPAQDEQRPAAAPAAYHETEAEDEEPESRLLPESRPLTESRPVREPYRETAEVERPRPAPAAEDEVPARRAPEPDYATRPAPRDDEDYRRPAAAEARPQRPIPVEQPLSEGRPAAPQIYDRPAAQASEPRHEPERRPEAERRQAPSQAQQPPLADFLIRKLGEAGAMTLDELCGVAIREGYFAEGDNPDRTVHTTLMNVVKAGFIRQLPNGTFAPATVMDTIRLRRAI